MTVPELNEIRLLQKQKVVELIYENGEQFRLPCIYLRAFTPSADKKMSVDDVNIVSIEPVGNYAVKLVFTDGHNTGIYSWNNLYDLAVHHEKNWQNYLAKKADGI